MMLVTQSHNNMQGVDFTATPLFQALCLELFRKTFVKGIVTRRS